MATSSTNSLARKRVVAGCDALVRPIGGLQAGGTRPDRGSRTRRQRLRVLHSLGMASGPVRHRCCVRYARPGRPTPDPGRSYCVVGSMVLSPHLNNQSVRMRPDVFEHEDLIPLRLLARICKDVRRVHRQGVEAGCRTQVRHRGSHSQCTWTMDPDWLIVG